MPDSAGSATTADGVAPMTTGSGSGSIEVRRARENNLKNVTLRIPKRKITALTGVPGSGKSSLVFDTIAATIAETMDTTYGRPFPDAENLGRTAVDQALAPALAEHDRNRSTG
jgi:excinuclease UvrABC ATPase subunit